MPAPPQSSSRSRRSAAATSAPERTDGGVLEALTALTIGAAIAAPIVVRGGFTPVSQWVFVALSLLGLGLAAIARRDAVRELASGSVAAALGGLGLLTLASAGWTQADPGAALRAGLLVLGALALALTAGTLAGRERRWVLATVLAVAVVEALLGSAAALLRDEPLAERLSGGWRPGGTFEYSPALALLCVTALPIAIASAAARGPERGFRARVGLAALAASILAASLGLSDSRLALALGLVALAASVALSGRLGLERRRTIVVSLAALGAGAVTGLALGGPTGFGVAATEGDASRLTILAAIVLTAALLAAALAGRASTAATPRRAREPARGRRVPVAVVFAAAAALLATGIAAGASSEGAAEPVGVEGDGGITHGRTEQWSAALAAGAERPLLGWGAGAYSLAAAEQGASFALYAHSLPLESFAELGVLGLLLVLALYATCALAVWRARHSPMGPLAGWGVLCFGLVCLVDWPWHLAGSVAVFATLLGIALEAGLGGDLRARPARVEP